jgi:phage terminase small subunit
MGKPGPKPGGVNPASIAALREHGGDPETAALTHQGRRWLGRALAPSCDHCAQRDRCDAYEPGGTCRIAEAEQARIVEALQALPHVRPEHDAIVTLYARDCVLLGIIAQYIADGGPFLPGAPGYIEAQPVLEGLYNKTAARMLKAADALGLTPAARNRLGLDQEGRPQGLAHIMSAEFEPVETGEEGTHHADD